MSPQPIPAPVLLSLPTFRQPTGRLTVGEFDADLPFAPTRVFMLTGVPPDASRAGHAQREGTQVLISVTGTCHVDTHSGPTRRSFRLSDPTQALLVPPRTWLVCHQFSAGAAVLVLASNRYDPADQISDYDCYRQLTSELA
jgi:UDP-2-acetamido-3-amino-2,3-dideoxy-glucuronate N-acetyltransferase